MNIDVQFVTKKVVKSQNNGNTYFFADFIIDGTTFSAFLPADAYNKLDSCSLGQHVMLFYEPCVYKNKLQFNLKNIEVI